MARDEAPPAPAQRPPFANREFGLRLASALVLGAAVLGSLMIGGWAFAAIWLIAGIVGAAEWHINADESDAFDYEVEHKDTPERARWYQAGPFRSSDHDPLIVGLKR